MAHKKKTFRGDRSKRTYNPCGCFHCTGYDRDKRKYIKDAQHLDKEIEVIMTFK